MYCLQVSESALEGLSEMQRAVLEPPYAVRLDRPLVTQETVRHGADGPVERRPRAEHKKSFDKRLFGTSYF